MAKNNKNVTSTVALGTLLAVLTIAALPSSHDTAPVKVVQNKTK